MNFYIASAIAVAFMFGVYVGWCIGWRERGELYAAEDEGGNK
jgi:hypothetical protein